MSTAAQLLDVQPWEQQADEGAKAFAAFSMYRDMPAGTRSTTKVAAKCDRHVRLITRWCTRWRWVDRAIAYDRHIDRLARAEHEKEIIAFRKRVAQQARGKCQTLMLADMVLSKKLTAPDALDALQALSVEQLINLSTRCAFPFPGVVKVEALALGDITDRVALPVDDGDTLDDTIASDDDLLSAVGAIVEQASALRARRSAHRAGDGPLPEPARDGAGEGAAHGQVEGS